MVASLGPPTSIGNEHFKGGEQEDKELEEKTQEENQRWLLRRRLSLVLSLVF
jgi:hypothetical protein